jgi:myosin heavy subunit
MLDIIDAQEALSTARLNQISAQYDYARYKATVENAMGMGLNASERDSAAELETDVDTTLSESSVAERAGDTAAALRAAEQKQAERDEEAK